MLAIPGAIDSRHRESVQCMSFDWQKRSSHALITHQDEITKVDLLSCVVSASADITRWSFDATAHIDAFTGDCLVYSYEQGFCPKKGSSLSSLFLDHFKVHG